MRGRAVRTGTVLALCGLFLFLAVGVALLSGNLYASAVDDADRNASQRTALSYLVNQVRRADQEGGVSVVSFGDGDALLLTEDPSGGNDYVTWIYCYNGSLMELYAEQNSGLGPDAGTAILPCRSLAILRDDGCLVFTVADEFGENEARVAPRCGWEGAA